MHTGTVIMTVYIRGFVSNQSQYAYGDFKAPRMHTGTVIVTVYIRGLIPLESPYAYCDWTNPGMRTGIHLGPHMHPHAKMITTMAKPNARPSDMAMVSAAAHPWQPHRDRLFDAAHEGFYSNA